MTLPAISQNISKGEIKTLVTENLDTLVIMHVDDAKLFLTDLLQCKLTDSLLQIFVWKDSVNEEKIILKDIVIEVLETKLHNTENIVKNLEEFIKNNEKIIELNKKTIKSLKKEIKKHKREKIVAIISAVVLPIVTALIILL